MENQLIIKAKENNINENEALNLQKTFAPFFDNAHEIKEKAMQIVVTDPSQVKEMQLARESRLALKNIRIDVEKTRKNLKEESLRKGKAIDGMASVIKYMIMTAEKHLQEQEDFIKNIEFKQKMELKEERERLLEPYGVDTSFYGDLSNMTDAVFQDLLETKKVMHQRKIEEEQKAEAERIAREKAEAEERERIRKENEKLKAEAVKREAEEKKRREAEEKIRKEQEAKLRKEREAREKLEREAKKKADAERKAKAEAEAKKQAELKAQKERERKEKLAPDREKLLVLAKSIDNISVIEVKSEEAKKVVSKVMDMFAEISSYIKKSSLNL